MQRDVGYQFVVALSDAIETATRALAREDPTAFRYRGSDLRHAVERSLYIALVNNRALYEAFRDRHGPDDLEASGSALERAVAVALLDGGERVGTGRPPWRRLGARALWHARALRDGSPPVAAYSPDRPVAFVLDHLKFLRFVEPVRRRIGPSGDVIVSVVPPLSEALAADGEDHVDLCRAAGRPPVGRAVGSRSAGCIAAPGPLRRPARRVRFEVAALRGRRRGHEPRPTSSPTARRARSASRPCASSRAGRRSCTPVFATCPTTRWQCGGRASPSCSRPTTPTSVSPRSGASRSRPRSRPAATPSPRSSTDARPSRSSCSRSRRSSATSTSGRCSTSCGAPRMSCPIVACWSASIRAGRWTTKRGGS